MTVTLGGGGSANQLRSDLASTASTALGDALMGVKKTGGIPTTDHAFHENRAFNIKTDFGATGDGVTNDTTAINTAIAYVQALPRGGSLYFPKGDYAVKELDCTQPSGYFTKTVRLYGEGRNITRIIPFEAGHVLINMMGVNNMLLEDMTIDSSGFTSQTAIFMARSTVSTNCNNNKFLNVFIEGSYSVASVCCNGSESSNWIDCRITNNYAAASYMCLWTGGGAGVQALMGVTNTSGKTVDETANPNTDNHMFGVEFYAPFASANPVRFSGGASYYFSGCTIICGSSNNCKLVSYGDPITNIFNGPIIWAGCHFEVFGTGNTVHYLNAAAGVDTYWRGISSLGGAYIVSNNTAHLDYDRTNATIHPILSNSTWTAGSTPNSSGSSMHVYIFDSCNIQFRVNNSDGAVYASGYAGSSTVDSTYFYATQLVGCGHVSYAAAIPTTGAYAKGEVITNVSPSIGTTNGWRCSTGGSLGTLSAITGTLTTGTNVLTLNSTTGLYEGAWITWVGAVGGPWRIIKLSGLVAYLDAVASPSVAGAAVSFSAGVVITEPTETGVTSVTGTAPVVSSGGATPAISMAAAGVSTDGYVNSTAQTFGGSKTFDVATTFASGFFVRGSAAPAYPSSGAGLEVVYDSDGKAGSGTGGSGVVILQSYDRGGSAFRDVWLNCSGFTMSCTVGFNGNAPIAKPTITGSRVANPALASLLTALANYGLITDSTTV